MNIDFWTKDKYGRDWNSSHEYRIQDHVEHEWRYLGSVIEGKKGIDPSQGGGGTFKNNVFSMESYCYCDGTTEGHSEACPPYFVSGDFFVT